MAPTATPTPAATPTVTPTATPSVITHLENGLWLERNRPVMAQQIIALPWVADGVTEDERWAAEDLIRASRWNPDLFELVITLPWLMDSALTAYEARAVNYMRWAAHGAPRQIAEMLGWGWVRDDLSQDEGRAVVALAWTAYRAPELAEALFARVWVTDDITRDEGIVLDSLYRIAWTETFPPDPPLVEAAQTLLNSPFLEIVESADALAVWDLRMIREDDAEGFLEIMEHPNFSDGVTDEEAQVVTVLSSAFRNKPASLPVLLDGLDGTGGVYLEQRTIETPLSGEVLLTIIRVRDKSTPNMDRLEHAVRVVEAFMGEPLPTNYVAWYLDDAARSKGKGYHAGTHITSSLVYDIVDGDSKSRTPMQHIAHEVGHYYFRGNTHQWLDEGPAKFFESISERERVGRAIAPFKRYCRASRTIAEQEQLRLDIWAGRVQAPDRWTDCDYYLGERFFLDLYVAMGDEAFRPGIRRLYLLSRNDDPMDDCEGIDLSLCHVETAFKSNASEASIKAVDTVVACWYRGEAEACGNLR